MLYKIGAIGGVIAIALILVVLQIKSMVFSPTATSLPLGEQQVSSKIVEVIAQDLMIPWDVAFLPDGDFLVTERVGSLQRIGKNPFTISIPEVKKSSEGGLLGMTLHPDFVGNNFLYLYYSYQGTETGTLNKVVRYTLNDSGIENPETIIEGIPGAQYHDGGRIAFGPDGNLYITTGDAGVSESAQNTDSLAGKILRITEDGAIPEDNPFNNAIYSYGHRNPQGITWDDQGNLWSTEHGRSGITKTGLDEINRIEKGKNYGWPTIEGDATKEGMEIPKAHSGPDETWAPGSVVYHNGSLWFGGLRGQALYEAKIQDGEVVKIISHFREQLGRIRTVVVGPDNYLYITTSNQDGRGTVRERDDKVLRITTSL